MKKGLWKKADAVLVSLTLLVGAAALPASAAALSENFEGFGSTDDLSMNWFGYGDFITDITLSKTGGVGGTKGLKVAVEYNDSAKDKWGTLRGAYADDMSSKVATGFRFWAKADQEGQEMEVIMVYNNMSWKYSAKVTLSKTGKYYEVPFSSMKLNYGTVTVPNGTDPQYINEWQFLFPRNLEVSGVNVVIDDISYIGDGPVTPTDPTTGTPTTNAPTTTNTPSGGDTTTSAGETTNTENSDPSDPASDVSDASDTPVGPADTTTTTASGASTVSTPENEGGGLGTGAIVGIVIAAVVVLAGAGAAVYFLVIRKKAPGTPGDPGQES